MTYFCYIEFDLRQAPRMEPLEADDPETAVREAARLLTRHVRGVAAHVFRGDQRLRTITRLQAAEF